MGTVKDTTINGYCDSVNHELSEMKEGILILREGAKKTYGVESVQFLTYERHLAELADMIDWKLQLLMKACPFDWEGAGVEADIERVVSVGPSGKFPDIDFSGGYVGG